MTLPDLLPDISSLSTDELLALRASIDRRLSEARNALLEQAQRLDGVIHNGQPKKRPGRRPKAQDTVT